jgi:hypothetical protein
MKCVRCTVCGRRVYRHDAVEFGWWDQFDDEQQAVVHRGHCESVMSERMFESLMDRLRGRT